MLHRVLRSFLYNLGASSILRGTNTLVFILVARLSGAEDAGRFALATTFVTIFLALSTWGVDELLIRDVSKSPEDASHVFGHAFILRTALSSLFYALLLGLTFSILPYPPRTSVLIAWLGFSLIPDSLSLLCQSLFVALERMGYLMVVAGVSGVLEVTTSVWVLSSGAGLERLTQLWVIISVFVMLVNLGLAWKLLLSVPRRAPLGFGLRAESSLLRQLPSFAFINAFLTTERQLDMVLLSRMQSESVVGWYGAASAILVALSLLPQAYRTAIFPAMARYMKSDAQRLTDVYVHSMRILLMAGSAIALFGIFALPIIIPLLYGHDFTPAVPVAQLLMAPLLIAFVNVPNSRLMIVAQRQREAAVFLAASMSVNVVLNILLIVPFGILGTACARVCSSSVFFGLNYVRARKLILVHSLRGMVLRVACAASVSVLLYVSVQPLNLIAATTVAMLGYGLTLLCMEKWAATA